MNWDRGKHKIAEAIHLDLTHNQERYAKALSNVVRSGDRWLDVGCGHSIVPEWAMSHEEQERLVGRAAFLAGVDVDDGITRHPLLHYRVMALGGRLPFQDASFDLVTANMVIEHVADPEEFLRDIFRVLRPGGRFLFVTPNCLNPVLFASRMVPDAIKKRVVRFLERREFEDIFPTRYRMNRPQTIAAIAGQAGFSVQQLRMIGSCGSLGRLGPVSWIECILMKVMQDTLNGDLQPDILGVLVRDKVEVLARDKAA